MKRIGLFLLAAVMVAGLAGCPGKNHTADVVGTWTMTNDWYCDGSMDTFTWYIQNNGTFISSSGSTGTYDVDGNDITLNYANGTIYSGNVDGDTMDGTMVAAGSGGTGCWSAYRISHTP